MKEWKQLCAAHTQCIGAAVLVLVVSGSLFLLASAAREMRAFWFVGQDIAFTRTIVVSGEGEATALPDIVTFSFAVIKEADEAAAAQEAVTETMNGLVAFLKGFGVEDKDIKTTSYSISPRYEFRKTASRSDDGTRILVGYEASHWLEVKVRDTAKTGDILAGIGERGATSVSNIQFVVDDEEEVLREARADAIADARKKAKQLARDLDVRLVRVVSFSESGGPIFFRTAAAEFGMGGDAKSVPAPLIPSGENKVTSQVTIVYAID